MSRIAELKEKSHKSPILFFDGVCHLCNGFVNGLIKKDHNMVFTFCALQSKTGQLISDHLHLPQRINTVILLHRGRWYVKSDVSFEIIRILGGWWKCLLLFNLLPLKLKNWCYDRIAQNRYKWFGQAESCMIPDKSLIDRFILD